MDQLARFTTLNAVLLGVLLIGTSLPFDADDPSALWTAHSTGLAAGTKLAVIALSLLLVVSAAAGVETWLGVVQSVVSILVVVGVAALSASTASEAGSGSTLIMITALVSTSPG